MTVARACGAQGLCCRCQILMPANRWRMGGLWPVAGKDASRLSLAGMAGGLFCVAAVMPSCGRMEAGLPGLARLDLAAVLAGDFHCYCKAKDCHRVGSVHDELKFGPIPEPGAQRAGPVRLCRILAH